MAKPIRNIGASVRARLLALSREKGQTLDLLLTRYALERLLYRLSVSPYRDRFVLKGAMLITTWFDNPHRATRDVDLLGYGDPSPEPMLATFREIGSIAADDDLTFDSEALRVDLIREELEYGGLRLRTTASLAGARIGVVIDIESCSSPKSRQVRQMNHMRSRSSDGEARHRIPAHCRVVQVSGCVHTICTRRFANV